MKTIISATDIKEFTAANLSVEAHKLEIVIPQAQQRHLRPLLGLNLFTALVGFVQTGPELPAEKATPAELTTYATSLTAWRTAEAANPMLELFDQVRPMLSQWALVEAWPNMLVHLSNAGVVIKTGNAQATTTADAATLGQVLTAHRATAVWQSEELVSWLEAHKSDYPAYVSTRPRATAVQPIDHFGGISL